MSAYRDYFGIPLNEAKEYDTPVTLNLNVTEAIMLFDLIQNDPDVQNDHGFKDFLMKKIVASLPWEYRPR